MKIKTINWVILLAGLLIIGSCKKDNTESTTNPNTQLTLKVTHQVDGKELIFDSMCYVNAGGNKYSVTKLNYYLNGFVLTTKNGDKVYLNGYTYIDGRNPNNQISIGGFSPGTFTNLSFYIGLDPQHNVSGALENSLNNINMAWPEVIGGGYHFLKMEGYYLDSIHAKQGFTMHLGTNEMLVKHVSLPLTITLADNGSSTINLSMNLNEWFKNPHTWDFNKDGNYTMAIPELMTLLKNNGTDVFTIQP
ncbi:MAG: hypothetical protein CFE21_08490 [Bacteroidetes bacterium B1(2017)]|nr:MAG: hypothetical protein CFE21_08490 [Bacteroidetes bacterium B1(2017)]